MLNTAQAKENEAPAIAEESSPEIVDGQTVPEVEESVDKPEGTTTVEEKTEKAVVVHDAKVKGKYEIRAHFD